ncbi:DUF1360 domain-containing protein [Saliterribacillus persicus]|uniref:Uncharacterized protein DUF1360 n=1 Tax=Saliterribacillus persicus TaxID=930114 RepID=A0A368Y2R6_9BACI|nr:DUF1360 domain-containing protein [Saliterribacillus persicus]RCW73117.1 uncharacterized protein DUF1360 [Saliterribacillus persicus]
MTFFYFLMLALATFRLTRLIQHDKITAFIRAPFILREDQIQEDGTVEEVIYYKRDGIGYFIAELLICHWCLGIWISAFLFFGFTYFSGLFLPLIFILAIAAVASIVELSIQFFN